jgi:hypothetical protein
VEFGLHPSLDSEEEENGVIHREIHREESCKGDT